MEEKIGSKEVKLNATAQQKLSYEELNQACGEMSQQLQDQNAYIIKLHRHLQQLEMDLQTRRVDYLLKVIELANGSSKFSFDSDFVDKCIEEVQESLTIPEQPESENKE